jgi:predicted nucleic acid-binding protein
MKAGKAFFDTNIIVYAFQEGAGRQQTALDLLAAGGVTSVQVLNEFAHVARRKLGFTWPEIQEAVTSICVLLPDPAALLVQTHVRAARLAQRFGFSIYDGLIAAAALETGCRVLYTEDMQSGQKIEGLIIRNPFL